MAESPAKQPASNYDLQVDIGKRLFMEYDQNALIRKYQLSADRQWIYLAYLAIPCRISRTDGSIEEMAEGVWQPCRRFNTGMTIYDLLCYHTGATPPNLANSWCTVGSFIITGVQNASDFAKGYAALFDGHTDTLQSACLELGGTIQNTIAGADLVCRFQVTPFFPVLLQFWSGDEEFPAKLQLLWDRNTTSFLHFETTFYLQGDLLDRLKQHYIRKTS